MNDTLYVVETEDDIHVGRLEFVEGGVIVRTGYAGHPKRIDADDITLILPAHMHSKVESVDYGIAV